MSKAQIEKLKQSPDKLSELITGHPLDNIRAISKQPEGFSAKQLIAADFPEPTWVMPGILPEGLTILAGRPKIGKSWLALGIAVAVAAGGIALGQIRVKQNHVVYLALEDSERRLKSRLNAVLQGDEAPEGLFFYNQFPRLDQGGLQELELAALRHDAKLLIIDTLGKMRPQRRKDADLYQSDYDAIGSLKAIADRHSAAIMVLHHQNKASGGDILDSISGTLGLPGAADSNWILKRGRGEASAELFAGGRDFEEKELALHFDTVSMSWQIVGTAEEFRLSQERREIIEVLKNSEYPLAPKEIAKIVNKNYSTVAKLLHAMNKDGEIRQSSYGKYIYTNNNYSNSSISSNSNESGISGKCGKSSESFTNLYPDLYQGDNSQAQQGQKKQGSFTTFTSRNKDEVIDAPDEFWKTLEA